MLRQRSKLLTMNAQRLTVISAVIIVLVVAGLLIVPRLTGQSASAELDYASQPVAGSRDAPVQIGVFFDFLCPHCATFSETVTPVLKREFVDSGTAAIYFFNFPVVDPVRSRSLAVLGECVARQDNDAFVALEPVMLRAQSQIGVISRAVELALDFAPNLDGEALRACTNETQTAALVDADVAAARTLNLSGTPSVTVNGVVVSNPTLANIRNAVQNASN